jgi:hypothetical protein
LKKNILWFVTAAFLTCALYGCHARGAEEDPDQLLYDNGLSMIDLMTEMAGSDAYISAMSASAELSAIIGTISGGDYSKPDKVWKVTVPDGASAAVLEAYGMETSDISERLMSELDKRIVSAAATRLNAMSGAATIAAASILTVNDDFLCEGLDHSVIYIYHFDGAASVMINFLPGDESIVSEGGCFIVDDIWDDIPEEGIADFLAENAYLPNCEVSLLTMG